MRIHKPLALVLGLAAAACASRTTSSSEPSTFSDNEFRSSSSSWSTVEDRSVQDGSSTSVTVTENPAPIVTYREEPYAIPANPPRGSVQDIIRQYDQMPTQYSPDRTEIQSDGSYRR